MARRLAVALALAALAAAAPAAPAARSDAAAFQSSGGAICAELSRSVAALAPPDTKAELPAYLERVASLFTSARRRVAGLSAPRSLRARLRLAVAAQAAADRQLTRVAGALRHGANPGAAPSFPRLARMRAYRSFERLNALANRRWRRAGLKACA
jgi:hypothetical protein